MPTPFTDEASENSPCLSPSFSLVVSFSLTPLSTKYFKGQCLTAKAKGLVWFLSSSLYFLSVSFPFVCFLVFSTVSSCITYWFFFPSPPLPLRVHVSSPIVFHCEVVGRINCLSWPESCEITLGRGGHCFEWYSIECNAIV